MTERSKVTATKARYVTFDTEQPDGSIVKVEQLLVDEGTVVIVRVGGRDIRIDTATMDITIKGSLIET